MDKVRYTDVDIAKDAKGMVNMNRGSKYLYLSRSFRFLKRGAY